VSQSLTDHGSRTGSFSSHSAFTWNTTFCCEATSRIISHFHYVVYHFLMFVKGGVASFTVGSIGVIVPFFVGYFVFAAFGFRTLESLLVATTLTATSIAISIQVLTELGKVQSKEARLILGAAIVDDILAIAALSVVTTMVQTGNTAADIIDVTFLVLVSQQRVSLVLLPWLHLWDYLLLLELLQQVWPWQVQH
jgi:Kef-type K+ transport system membrane component KefB